MSGREARLRAELTPVDRQVLELLSLTRIASSTQIRRLVFTSELSPEDLANGAGARASRRLLTRLVKSKLIRRLSRRIGGPGGGSAAPIYVLTAVGQRVTDGDRPLVREPSWTLMAHSLAISEVVVQALVLRSLGVLKLRRVEVEPVAWRRWPGPLGSTQVLKPDAYLEIERGGYLEAWFIEADLGTERARAIRVKAQRYQQYRRSGREQGRLGLFPRVLWAVPDSRRAIELRDVLERLPEVESGLHVAVPTAEVAGALCKEDDVLAHPRPPP